MIFKGEKMNNQHTVEIISCLKRQIRFLHQEMMSNLDNKFNPIDKELDNKLDKQIDELNNRLKRFSTKERCALSDMYLRLYA
jgi:hypothetical protein